MLRNMETIEEFTKRYCKEKELNKRKKVIQEKEEYHNQILSMGMAEKLMLVVKYAVDIQPAFLINETDEEVGLVVYIKKPNFTDKNNTNQKEKIKKIIKELEKSMPSNHMFLVEQLIDLVFLQQAIAYIEKNPNKIIQELTFDTVFLDTLNNMTDTKENTIVDYIKTYISLYYDIDVEHFEYQIGKECLYA